MPQTLPATTATLAPIHRFGPRQVGRPCLYPLALASTGKAGGGGSLALAGETEGESRWRQSAIVEANGRRGQTQNRCEKPRHALISFRPAIAATMTASSTSRTASSRSWKNAAPTRTVPTAPMPVQMA